MWLRLQIEESQQLFNAGRRLLLDTPGQIFVKFGSLVNSYNRFSILRFALKVLLNGVLNILVGSPSQRRAN